MKWESLRVLWLAIGIFNAPSLSAALGDDAYFGNGVTERASSQLSMAWVSDIHLQPHYCVVANPKERHGARRAEPADSHGAAGRIHLEVEASPELGRAGCGSSRILFNETLDFLKGLVAESHAATTAGHPSVSSTEYSAVKAAFSHYPLPPINTVLLTGDFAYSGKNVDPNYLEDTLKEFTSGLFERFPQQLKTQPQGHSQVTEPGRIQLVLVVGNHDFPPEALLAPQRTWWANRLYDIWKPALPGDERTRETFMRGMYYSTDLWTAPQVRVLCLNTNLYAVKLRKAAAGLLKSDKNEDKGEDAAAFLHTAGDDAAEESDPAGQFRWLTEELRSARTRGQQAIICGHIMPALTVRLGEFAYFRDNWESAYVARYMDIVSAYSDVVAAQLYGHQHEGTMVALLPRGTQARKAAATAGPGCNPRQPNESTAILTIPSISPQKGNNPAIRVLLFDAHQDNPEQRQEYTEQGSSVVKLGAYALADYTQYHLPLYGFVGQSGFGRAHPVFQFESSFQDTFRPFMRCAKPSPLSLADATKGRGSYASPGVYRCIDGSTALQVADAVERSPFAYAAYVKHRYAEGKDVASAALSCSSLAMTEEDFIECIRQVK